LFQGRDSREARSRGSSGTVSKQPQTDVGNEDWETTSENSEEHIEDHKESRNSRNKHFSGRAIQASQNAIGVNVHSRRSEQRSGIYRMSDLAVRRITPTIYRL